MPTRAVPGEIGALLEQCGVEQSQVDWVICHQANRRIIEAAARRLKGIPSEKFLMNIQEYGNTSAASIPLLVDECCRKGLFHEGGPDRHGRLRRRSVQHRLPGALVNASKTPPTSFQRERAWEAVLFDTCRAAVTAPAPAGR